MKSRFNNLEDALKCITSADENEKKITKHRLDKIAKPLNSLGDLEDCLVRLSGVNKLKESYKKAVIVMCADNGVVCENVSQSGSEITALVAKNMTCGESSVCCMARVAGAKVFPIDIGMSVDVPLVPSYKKVYGTNDMMKMPAMSRDVAIDAIMTGILLVWDLKNKGYDLLATGEMGIGNTTTSAAICAVLLGETVENVTGKGAGLSDDGLLHKIEVIKEAIRINAPNPIDPIDVLCKVGGLDIAGMAGVFLGGAIYRVPIIMDGLISNVAALVAKRIEPKCVDYMIASHLSKEPACKYILKELGVKPLLSIGMALGEGTGAVTVMPLIDMALAIYFGMPCFADIGMEAYKPL